MKLRLKEDPREWRKFGLNSALVLALLAGVLYWREVLPKEVTLAVLAGLLAVTVGAVAQSRWLRGPYRVGMRVSHALGRVVAPLVLGLVFFLVLTPLGLLLRLLGKDLLRLRRDPAAATYWQPTSGSTDLTKMF
jgi:hypothetical protein